MIAEVALLLFVLCSLLYTSRSIQPIIFLAFHSTLFLFPIPEFVVGVFDPFVWLWSIPIKNLGFGQSLSPFPRKCVVNVMTYFLSCKLFSILTIYYIGTVPMRRRL